MTTHPTLENLEIQHSAATRILHIEKRPQDIVAVVLKAKYTRVLAAAPQLLKALKLVVSCGNHLEFVGRLPPEFIHAIEESVRVIKLTESPNKHN